MEPITALASLAKAALDWCRRPLKSWFAESAAAKAPAQITSIEQTNFDDILGRLAAAKPGDSTFKVLVDAGVSRLFSPDFLRGPNVRAWLMNPQTQRGITALAEARLLGRSAPQGTRANIEGKFQEIALANAQESTAVVDAVVAVLAAGLKARTNDTGNAALTVALSKQVESGFERLAAKLDYRAAIATGPLAVPDLEPVDEITRERWMLAFASASTPLVRWPTTVGNGAYIARPELDQLATRVQTREPGVVALLGPPGSGKSALLSKLAQLMTAAGQNMPVLAIKGDVLDAAVDSEEALQRHLQLPDLPSTMLRRLGAGGPTALLVDQLDALAGHLDAKTGRLSTLLNLVKAVSRDEGVFVLVSCRTFEFTHDIRLSHIDATSLTLELPPWEAVLPVLETQGVQAAGLNSDARQVLRVPQHLNTFLQLRAAGIREPVSNYTAMLDRLWLAQVVNAPGGADLVNLAFELAETMADKEVLWLAAARYDDRAAQINRLQAAGILTTSDLGAIGFSHQTVFEHVLARSFTKAEGRLSAYVLARTESLYVRPKVWAALAYLRGVERQAYEVELRTIWNAHGLRRHLRFLLIEFMGSQPEPTDVEELLLAGAGAQAELLPIVLKAVVGSPGWLDRLSGDLIPQAMVDSRTADLCVAVLDAAWPFAPERVAALVCERWVPLDTHDRRSLYVLQDAPKWTPALTQAARSVLSRTPMRGFSAEHFISTVGAVDADVAVALLRSILDGELSRCVTEATRLKAVAEQNRPAEGEPDLAWHMEHSPYRPIESLLDDRESWSSLPELAAAAPKHFIDVIWPWCLTVFQSLLDLSASERYLGFPLAYRADFRFEGEERNNIGPSSLLESITTAVEELARSAPSELIAWAKEQEPIALTPVQRLVAHALAANPEKTASAALSFLLGDERRYVLGGLADASSTTRALVAACAPWWQPRELETFVEKVRSFAPPRPDDIVDPDGIKRWYAWAKRLRLNLLHALPLTVRPSEVQRELDEDDRAHPQQGGAAAFTSMRAHQFERASTEDIVNAFKEIPDASGWDHPRHGGSGGNIQLSREFADFAKKNAKRATEVVGQLQAGFAQRAVGYAINALAPSIQPDELMDLIVDAQQRGFDHPEFRRSVAYAVDNLLERDIIPRSDVLSIMERWLPTEIASAPAAAREHVSASGSDSAKGFLLSGHPSMRVVPSGDFPILSSLVRARLARDEDPEVIRVLRQYLATTPDPGVWEFLADLMPPLAWEKSGSGKALIGDVLSLAPLEGTQSAAMLMAKTYWKAPSEILAALPRWRQSTRPAARKGFGELVALIAVASPGDAQAKAWLNELVDAADDELARVGAAATAVQLLWPESQYRAAATDLLLRLLDKDEAEVWQQLFGVFSLVDRLEPDQDTIRLLHGIADRIDKAPAPSEPHVVERLGGLLPRHADLVARIVVQLIQLWREQLASIGSSLATAGQEMMDLALTLHRIEGTKLEGLQMFEQLIEIDAYQAREVLDELDHRVRLGTRPMRPRLRRRGRKRKSVDA